MRSKHDDGKFVYIKKNIHDDLYLYADDRYVKCDIGTVAEITKLPNVVSKLICYYFDKSIAFELVVALLFFGVSLIVYRTKWFPESDWFHMEIGLMRVWGEIPKE